MAKTLIEVISDGLREEMARDQSIVVLGEDVGVMGGVFRATHGLQEAFGEERVIDSPLAESAIIGVAIGMSLNGLRPVAEIQFADFIHSALEAAERLSQEGVESEVVDIRTLSPLDNETILASAKKTGKVLIVHEDNQTLGLGAEIAARIADKAFDFLDAPVSRLAAPDVPSMPYAPNMEEFCLPDTDRIEAAMREIAAY